MSRRQKMPLRPLSEEEKLFLQEVSRSRSLPWAQVARARALLAVSEGKSYTQAALEVGYKLGDTVSDWVCCFNLEGLNALEPKHGGGPSPQYGPEEKERILQEFHRKPERSTDGTATWTLTTLQKALHQKDLPHLSTYTLWRTLHEAGYTWQKNESWCSTGKAMRKRKTGWVEVEDPHAEKKKILIEAAYLEAEGQGLSVWCTDQAGPYQTKPYSGNSWEPAEQPARQSHESLSRRQRSCHTDKDSTATSATGQPKS